jgi:hypothetical protein
MLGALAGHRVPSEPVRLALLGPPSIGKTTLLDAALALDRVGAQRPHGRRSAHRPRSASPRHRWGAVVLLAGLADDDAELLRQAANDTAAEWTDWEAARLLDAATLAEIGA